MMKRFLKSIIPLFLGFIVFIAVDIFLDAWRDPEYLGLSKVEYWCYFFIFTLYPCFFSLVSGIWFRRKNLYAGKILISAVILLSFVVNLFLFGWRYYQDVSFGDVRLYDTNLLMIIFPDSSPYLLSFLFTIVFLLSLLLSSYEKTSGFLVFLFWMRIYLIYTLVVYVLFSINYSLLPFIRTFVPDMFSYGYIIIPLIWVFLALVFGISWGYTSKRYHHTTFYERLIMAGYASIINVPIGCLAGFGIFYLLVGLLSTIILLLAFFLSSAFAKRKYH